jgi:shikimate kinase
MKIFVVGMPGSGKTFIGKKLSLSLKLKFYDLDIQIEKDEQQSIKQIIYSKGEAYFRKIESGVLRKLEGEKNIVISCGGGTPLFYDNMEFMKRNGIVIWINTDLSLIKERIQKNITRRPQFEGLDDVEIGIKIHDLYQLRQQSYKKSDIEIKINGKEINLLNTVIQQVIKTYKRKIKKC